MACEAAAPATTMLSPLTGAQSRAYFSKEFSASSTLPAPPSATFRSTGASADSGGLSALSRQPRRMQSGSRAQSSSSIGIEAPQWQSGSFGQLPPLSPCMSAVSGTSLKSSQHPRKRFARLQSNVPLSRKEAERARREHIEALWNKPRRAPWGRTAQDMLENFKCTTGRDYDAFRALRVDGVTDLDEHDFKVPMGLVQGACLPAMEDAPAVATWHGSMKALRDDFAGAVATLGEAVDLDENNLRAWRERAVAKMELGDFHGVAEDMARVFRFRSDFAGDWVIFGEAQLGLERFEQAEEAFETATQLDNRRIPAWRGRAFAKFKLGNLASAVEDCDRCLHLEPGQPEVHLVRARSKLWLGEYEECLEDYNLALRHDATQPYVWLERAQAKLAIGDKDGASKDLTKAIELDPRNTDSWLRRARIMMEQKETRQAFRDCTKLILLDPTIAEAWAMRGEAKVLLGDLSGAFPDFEEAARLDPCCVLPWYYSAKAKFQKGLFIEAEEDLLLALEVDPEHQRSLELLEKCRDSEVRLKHYKMEGYLPNTPRRKGQEYLIDLRAELALEQPGRAGGRAPVSSPSASPSSGSASVDGVVSRGLRMWGV